ncbi:hypothetical protein N7499_003027 [Penicillium canescens]|uniref:Uncharacterized protein n=1 Tax=Penicillium canescens TaxID=5083 RepID=A0AAD6IAP7_PENCN|nr:uncharacterized protein N7446_011905 [Penicillium canescens]KAJ6039155.1 hypothetical protein N7460_007187 [Penicillium canescens]KAJ6047071.1 hypothetical protein N7446_011905 [Penicillium canescens]KAJ6059819.1 hypothetical protein N7444_003458 [Penicillium canescens]KAJ6088933.1 hypothetical protein N7499_004184 [Penicillium canescens]KAJ6093696.1 hypothetical protein N7499_003027 [Penicillium canescens]
MKANRRVFSWKVGRLPPGALLHTLQGLQGWKFWAFWAEFQQAHLARQFKPQVARAKTPKKVCQDRDTVHLGAGKRWTSIPRQMDRQKQDRPAVSSARSALGNS